MDTATLLGLLLGLVGVIGGNIMEGGSPTALINLPGFLIVVVGSLGAGIASYPMATVKLLPKLLGKTFKQQGAHTGTVVPVFVSTADKARREGLLSLEEDAQKIDDAFMRKGLQLMIDGTDPEQLRAILDTDIGAMEERHEAGRGLFEAIGGYAPTLGVLGAIMGLISVLSHLDEPEHLGAGIAVAFIASFYGVFTVNPHEIAVDGQTLYVSHYRADRVTALALPDGAGARQITTPPRPHGVAVDGAGRVWITTATDGSIHRLRDQETDRRIALGETPHALVIDPRRDRSYVAVAGTGEVVAVDLSAGTVLARQAVGAVAEAIALSADGRRLAVASAGTNTVTVLDADPLTAVLQIFTPGRPVRVAFAGRWLLASLTDRAAVAVIDSESGEIAALFSVGRLPDGIAVDAGQRFAFVANTGDDSISAIDLERLTVIGILPTGDGPSGIVWVAEALG